MNKKKIFVILFVFLFSFSFFNSAFSANIASITLFGSSNVTNKSATISANIENLNGLTEIRVWFEYGLYKTGLSYKSPVVIKSLPDLMSFDLTNLYENTTYYYRFCHKSASGEICTNIDNFKTYLTPTSDVTGYSNVGYGVATVFGRIDNVGSDVFGKASKYWFEYGIGPSYSDVKTTEPKDARISNIVNEKLEFLKEDKDYYFKICVKNSFGSYCSDSMNFKTPKNVPIIVGVNDPLINLIEPIQINANSLRIIGDLKRIGEFSSLYYYFEYGNDNNLGNVINENKKISKVGKIEYILKDLEFNKDYYYRICVRSLTDYVTCSEIKNFRLKDYKNEELGADKLDIFEIKDKSVKISGIVNGFGGANEVSVWLNISDGVLKRETAKIFMKDFGRIFENRIESLTPGTKYIYKICIDNLSKISCSKDYEFTTLKNPTIDVNNILELSNGNVTIVGNMKSSGVYLEDKLYGWFEYGNSEEVNKFKKTTKNILGASGSSYVINNIDLSKKYYYRFCVDSGLPILCTNTKNFIAKNIVKEPKIVITNIVKNGNNLTATLKPINLGGEKSARVYIEYNSIKDSFWKTKILNVSNINEVTININGLKDNRKYYYRACIKNNLYTKCNNLNEIILNNLSKGEYLKELSEIDKTVVYINNDFSKQLLGNIIVKTDDVSNLWYVNPKNLKRYLLGNENNFYNVFKIFLEKTDEINLKRFPVYLGINYGADTDKDGISDILEGKIGTNIKDKDTDKDGYNDLDEINNGYNPNKKGGEKIKLDNVFINKNLGKFFVLKNGDIWYTNKENKKRYYIGNESNKKDIYRVLKEISKNLSYDDFLMIDYYELKNSDFGIIDSDNDGISDYYEINYYRTNPFSIDSNNNGCSDIKEINKEC